MLKSLIEKLLKEEKKKPVVKIRGKESPDKPRWPDWIRSENEIIDKFGKKYKVEDLAKWAIEDNAQIADNVTLNLQVSDLYKYREYDREIVDGWSGTNTEKEYNEIKDSIKKSGIQSRLVLNMKPKGNSMEISLGEGNHRLKAAKELKLKTVPVMVYIKEF